MFILQQDPSLCFKDRGWWISEWGGDPSRTLVKESAKQYKTMRAAKIARTYYVKRYSHIRRISLNICEVQS